MSIKNPFTKDFTELEWKLSLENRFIDGWTDQNIIWIFRLKEWKRFFLLPIFFLSDDWYQSNLRMIFSRKLEFDLLMRMIYWCSKLFLRNMDLWWDLDGWEFDSQNLVGGMINDGRIPGNFWGFFKPCYSLANKIDISHYLSKLFLKYLYQIMRDSQYYSGYSMVKKIESWYGKIKIDIQIYYILSPRAGNSCFAGFFFGSVVCQRTKSFHPLIGSSINDV